LYRTSPSSSSLSQPRRQGSCFRSDGIPSGRHDRLLCSWGPGLNQPQMGTSASTLLPAFTEPKPPPRICPLGCGSRFRELPMLVNTTCAFLGASHHVTTTSRARPPVRTPRIKNHRILFIGHRHIPVFTM
jgi:hypothetical protein